MNDQEQPIIPEIVSTPAPATTPTPATDDNVDSHIKLEDLPQAPREFLDSLIKMGYGSFKIKSELEKKFGAIKDITPAARRTYDRYIEKHYARLEAEKKAEDVLAGSLKEDNEAGVNYLDALLNDESSTRREQLENMKRYFIQRVEFLEKYQSQGLPSNQLENNILSYANGIRGILEKTIELDKDLSNETATKLEDFFYRTFDIVVSKILDAYRKIHGDTKLIEFSTEITPALREAYESQLLEIHKEDDGETTKNNSKS